MSLRGTAQIGEPAGREMAQPPTTPALRNPARSGLFPQKSRSGSLSRDALACTRRLRHGSFRRPRRHDAHINQLQPEAGDPLHESVQGALIRELSTKRRDTRADADFAVIKFRPHRGTRLTHECHLVCS